MQREPDFSFDQFATRHFIPLPILVTSARVILSVSIVIAPVR